MTTFARKGLEHLGINRGLLLDGRLAVTVQEAQLGAEQPDSLDRRLPAARAAEPSATLARIET